ncbi:MAG TPA: hypothetical protein VFG99_04485, partial [Chloroflexia bacterium]|nr:hypothetical protein [Chloroflexia bacterium]
GIPFVQCPSSVPGIWAHVHGTDVEIIRVPMVSDADAVEYVLGGTDPSIGPFRGEGITSTVRPSVPSGMTLSDLVAILPARAGGDRLTLEGLRTAAKRPGFPEALPTKGERGAHLYPTEDVLAWHRNRV